MMIHITSLCLAHGLAPSDMRSEELLAPRKPKECWIPLPKNLRPSEIGMANCVGLLCKVNCDELYMAAALAAAEGDAADFSINGWANGNAQAEGNLFGMGFGAGGQGGVKGGVGMNGFGFETGGNGFAGLDLPGFGFGGSAQGGGNTGFGGSWGSFGWDEDAAQPLDGQFDEQLDDYTLVNANDEQFDYDYPLVVDSDDAADFFLFPGMEQFMGILGGFGAQGGLNLGMQSPFGQFGIGGNGGMQFGRRLEEEGDFIPGADVTLDDSAGLPTPARIAAA